MVRTFSNGMEELTVELECRDAEVGRVGDALRTQIGIRIPVVRVDAGALPRFELKAKRVVDRRSG
jgi:phenylacetate-CoA ligase